jgi:hypothetical protein
LHTIPNKDEWTIIFNKTAQQWGSFEYKADQDALRVNVKPQNSNALRETLMFEFDRVTPTTAEVVLTWERLRVPFTVDAGDVNARVLTKMRKAVAEAKPDDFRVRFTAANFVLNNKLKDNYKEAMTWVDDSLKVNQSFGGLNAKARLSAEMGNYKDAAAYGEKALAAGRAATPPVNAELLGNLQKDIASWKTRN